jgi:hypothetical protein
MHQDDNLTVKILVTLSLEAFARWHIYVLICYRKAGEEEEKELVCAKMEELSTNFSRIVAVSTNNWSVDLGLLPGCPQ